MMQTRDMIEIDEELCDGCGLCVPSCHEGAIQVIDGKARLVSDSLCDGLGACLGHCPRGALKVTRREAVPFVAPVSLPTAVLAPTPAPVPAPAPVLHHHEGGCPGSRMRIMKPTAPAVAGSVPAGSSTGRAAAAPVVESPSGAEPSQLSHWPVQIRLVAPNAPFLDDARLVIAADCVPVALPGFHREFVAGSAVMIGCPKFDDLEAYTQRFTDLFSTARVRSVTVVVMEVPCCRSLPTAVRRGIEAAGTSVPLEVVVVGVDGEVRQRIAVPVGVTSGR
jgi:NAD-dependent dihydropyrimidine dehydrogenase PreA subunit